MPTLRQHLELIQRYSARIMAMEPEHLGEINSAAADALNILDASSTLDGALQTDVYRVVADDPHRAPERIAR